jgi:hypothetical protein
LFFDPKRYDLGRVGRYKINQKLGIKVDLETRIMTKEDIVAATKYLISLRRGEGTWTTSITSAAAASVRWANCSPTSAASVCPAPSVSSRNA